MTTATDESISWGRVVALNCLLFAAYAAAYHVFPAWVVSLCLASTAVVAASSLLSGAAPHTVGRLFAVSYPTPLWMLGTLPLVSVVVAGALVQYGPSIFPLLSAALGAGGSAYLLATVVGVAAGTSRPFDRHRVPLWVQTATVAASFASAYVLLRGTLTPTALVLFAGLLLTTVYVWFVVPLAVYHRHTRRRTTEPLTSYPTVSAIIPAYNEESVIARSIESVLASDYPDDRLEVIVVDDGSTDATYEAATAYRNRGVQVYRKSNGGKHSALNFGFLCASGDVVVNIDADSFVQPDTISTAVGELVDDPELGAVAGNVRVENEDRLVTTLQSIEYIFGIGTLRETFSHFGVVSIVPGCLGVFRREAIEAVDGYNPDTITEDFDLSMRLLRAGWHIRQSEAVVWTEAPFSWRDFYRQRLRWNFGTLQTLFKHTGMVTTSGSVTGPRRGAVYLLRAVLQLLVPLIAPVLLVDIAAGLLSGESTRVLASAGFFFVLSTLLLALTLELDARDGRLAVYSIPFFGYKLVIVYMALYTGFTYLVDGTVGWTPIRRTEQVD